jgi:hypothetical protein
MISSLCHTFSTMATGGFSPKNESIAFYRSPFLEYSITFFMFLAGANFALHYRFLKGNIKVLWRDKEFCFYSSVILLATLFITLNLWLSIQKEFFQAFRLAIFQVVSILTTTGFATADFEKWPSFSQYLLLTLMFIGGCAGSTGGAIKCVRIYILLKQGFQELCKLIHPRAVLPVKLGRKSHFAGHAERHLGPLFPVSFHFFPGLLGSLHPGLGFPDLDFCSGYYARQRRPGPGNCGPYGKLCPPLRGCQMDLNFLHALGAPGNLHPSGPPDPGILEKMNCLFFLLSRCILRKIGGVSS